jgi:hypothetical protein
LKIKHLKTKLIILVALILLNIVMNTVGNIMKTEYYDLTSDKLTASVRVVFISDLHNCTYGGSDQSELWQRIQAEDPDLVLFGGDVIDYKGGTAHALQLMKMVKETYPCAYVSGNHEVMRKDTEALYDEVKTLGVPVLHGESWDVTVSGQEIRLSGVVDANLHPEQLTSCCESLDDETYNILLMHEPQTFDDVMMESSKYPAGFDLVLSGHAHGGQWRIPGILEQGLYAPDQGIFPEFTNGQREEGGTVQIVSRGLAKPLRMFMFPRIFNQPELTVVEINPA